MRRTAVGAGLRAGNTPLIGDGFKAKGANVPGSENGVGDVEGEGLVAGSLAGKVGVVVFEEGGELGSSDVEVNISGVGGLVDDNTEGLGGKECQFKKLPVTLLKIVRTIELTNGNNCN